MFNLLRHLLPGLLALHACPVSAQPQPLGPPLDFSVRYYNRVLSPEGVLRESRYEEKVLRRPGHVWTYRVLPAQVPAEEHHGAHLHAHFNYAVTPRHITFDGEKTAVAFVDAKERYVVNIEPPEFGNVGFDGSWQNAYYLVDPGFIERLPVSSRPSPVRDAQWHETVKDGVFQHILWDNKRKIPLIAEVGDLKRSFYNRVEVEASAGLTPDLPWNRQRGYAQKIYADFLD